MPTSNVSFAVITQINEERAYQASKWGGQSVDDAVEPNDWNKYISEYAFATSPRTQKRDQRSRWIAIAAMAIAAVESLDRKAGNSGPHIAED